MSSTVRAFLVVAAVIAATCAVLLLTTESFCKLDAQSRFASSSAAYVATVENASCFLPNELRTTILLSGKNKSLYNGESPLVFVATPADMLNEPSTIAVPVRVEWFGDNELHIVYPKGTKVRSRVSSVNNINIVFTEAAAAP